MWRRDRESIREFFIFTCRQIATQSSSLGEHIACSHRLIKVEQCIIVMYVNMIEQDDAVLLVLYSH